MMRNRSRKFFLLMIVAGAVLGGLFGAFFPKLAVHTGFLGELFLNALKMMVLPLIVTSLFMGVANLGDVRRLGSVGVKTIAYFLSTTVIAVAIGIFFVQLVRPGEGFQAAGAGLPEKIRTQNFSATDILLSFIHPNLIVAAGEFQILPIIIATLGFGIAVTMTGEKGRPIIRIFDGMNEAVMKMVHAVILFTPAGIFGLIAHRLGIMGGGGAVVEVLAQLAKYCGTVILGLIVHGVFVLPLILFFLARRNPFVYFGNFLKAFFTALATSSSAATLPVTMECVTKESRVSPRIADVVLPLGATINMDGTALYEAVAAVFIAQSYGIALGPGELVIVCLTATLAAVSAAAIPEAGLVTMVLVLQSVGLPTEGIGLILAVDWFLDRLRTTVNVWGDAVGAAVVERLEEPPSGSLRNLADNL